MSGGKTQVDLHMQEVKQSMEESLSATKAIFGQDSDCKNESKRVHAVGQNDTGAFVAFRADGFFGQGYIVALYYWTGSCEHADTLKAAQSYCDTLNELGH